MWYKCLNPNCGFIFPATEECDKCLDCGKQDLREATSEEIASVNMNDIDKNIGTQKISFEDRFKNAVVRTAEPPKPTKKEETPNTKDEISPDTHPVYKEPER